MNKNIGIPILEFFYQSSIVSEFSEIRFSDPEFKT